DGAGLAIQRDTIGRPVLLRHTLPGHPALDIRLHWRGQQPIRLDHPDETEYLSHDAQGRVTTRTIHRPLPDGVLAYQEQYTYDTQGRLQRHDLPEGGALHYAWSATGRLQRLTWTSATGTRHTVIDAVPSQAGYRYGNGLWLQTAAGADGRADTLILSDGVRILWGERRRHDARGRVAARAILSADRWHA